MTQRKLLLPMSYLRFHYYTRHTTKLLGVGYIDFTPSVRPSVRPTCRVHSVTPKVIDGFVPHYTQMITIMRRCVAQNDLWSWRISSRSSSHNFAMKLLKYGTSCVRPKTHTVLNGFFPNLAQMTTSIWCVASNELWPWPIFSKSSSHGYAIKLLKYDTSCNVGSAAVTVLKIFSPYLAQMTTCMRECVIHNDLWFRPICTRSFSHDFVIKLLIYGTFYRVRSTVCTVLDRWCPYLDLLITSMRGCHTMTSGLDLYLHDYLAVALPLPWIVSLCGLNTTHEGTMCNIPFLISGRGYPSRSLICNF